MKQLRAAQKALEDEFWTLKKIKEASDDSLARLVAFEGIRDVIREEVRVYLIQLKLLQQLEL